MRRSLKSIAIASTAILTSLSLAAALTDPPPAAASTGTEATTSAAPIPLQAPASSLAAAAQRANAARRKTKSRIAITNANLSKKGGHITHYFVEQEEFDMPPLEAIKVDAEYMQNLKV